MPEIAPAGARRFPILSLVGGKWTTFRAFSAEATDDVLKRLGRTRRVSTEALAIGGGAGLSQAAAPAEALATAICRDHGLSRDRAHQLLRRYGSRASLVAASLGPDEQKLTALPEFSREEIAHVCDTELVETAEDFLFGRTSVFLERPLGHAALQELVEVMGEQNAWPPARRAEELSALVGRYARLHRIDVSAERGDRPRFAS
jgi:glycerol-3-phosphate dehydrogenase